MAPVTTRGTAVSASSVDRPGIIAVDHLRKAYGATLAVADVSFSVEEGEIFGIIGPNGAGKTTTVECLSGLRAPDSGTVRVLGIDPREGRDELRRLVGVQLQQSSLPPAITVEEALDLFASFYPAPGDRDELLRVLDLEEKRRDRFRNLSGGQKQRLSIALALIGNPKVAILDELTTGLDPQARRETWKFIETVRGRGVTVILVTHFMDEAERLCDRVLLIDHGKVIAEDTPANLADREGGGTYMRFRPSSPVDERLLSGIPGVSRLERDGRYLRIAGTGDLLSAVLHVLSAHGVEPKDVQVRTGTLDDAFVRLTSAAPRTGEEVPGP